LIVRLSGQPETAKEQYEAANRLLGELYGA
jgi:hypothetical protein